MTIEFSEKEVKELEILDLDELIDDMMELDEVLRMNGIDERDVYFE